VKLSPSKLLYLSLFTGLLLISPIVVLACEVMPGYHLEVHCLDQTAYLYQHEWNTYIADQSVNQLRNQAQADGWTEYLQTHLEPTLQRLDPCYASFAAADAIYQTAKQELLATKLRSDFIFTLSPADSTADIDTVKQWQSINSCYYSWFKSNGEWTAVTTVVKSYCTGEFDNNMCQNTIASSWTRFALEVAGLRETDMPETVRQTFFRYGAAAVTMAVALLAVFTWGSIAFIRKLQR
jgi:hypothetical protein